MKNIRGIKYSREDSAPNSSIKFNLNFQWPADCLHLSFKIWICRQIYLFFDLLFFWACLSWLLLFLCLSFCWYDVIFPFFGIRLSLDTWSHICCYFSVLLLMWLRRWFLRGRWFLLASAVVVFAMCIFVVVDLRWWFCRGGLCGVVFLRRRFLFWWLFLRWWFYGGVFGLVFAVMAFAAAVFAMVAFAFFAVVVFAAVFLGCGFCGGGFCRGCFCSGVSYCRRFLLWCFVRRCFLRWCCLRWWLLRWAFLWLSWLLRLL